MVDIMGSKGVGHHPCHHLYRLVAWQPETNASTRRLSSAAKRGLPNALRSVVAARGSAGESLRALARQYGVSNETIRRSRGAAGATATKSAEAPALSSRNGRPSLVLALMARSDEDQSVGSVHHTSITRWHPAGRD